MEEIGTGTRVASVDNENVLFLNWDVGRWVCASIHKYIFTFIL